MTADLIDRARSGDGNAFRELIAPYEDELRLHCYRMLGSRHDAEDALQEVLIAAWQGLTGFEGRASVRTWLYRVATTRCLNARRSAARRAPAAPPPGVTPPEPTRRAEVTWLEQRVVATRYSQVRTEARPSKPAMPCQAASRISCSVSSASCAEPSIR